MTGRTTAPGQRTGWTVGAFRRFWASPDAARVENALTEDVVGHWPGHDEPVRGKDDYTRCIAALVEAFPGMHLEVVEHAQVNDITFVNWVMHATGKSGPFELTGIDRVRVRDGLVAENLIVFDTAAFERRSGRPVPWT
jgi:ketosteroid isomerase-like protein